jgi:hypothetical protein
MAKELNIPFIKTVSRVLQLGSSELSGSEILEVLGTTNTDERKGVSVTDIGTFLSIGGGGTPLYANVADQTISGGANISSLSLGTVSSGTVTIDCGARPQQFIINNGAFTLAAPVIDGNCYLLVTNGASAGAIAFSGFTVGANTGDALTMVNGNRFTIMIWRINGVSMYRIAAAQ